MILLYRFPSCPFCDDVQEFMDAKKIPYKIVVVEKEKKPQEVLSTGGTVPVIKDKDKLISASQRIITYLQNTPQGESA